MTEVNPVIPAQLQAHKNGIDTMPLVCDGFRPLTAEALRTISTLWTSQQTQMLANYGISIEDVTLQPLVAVETGMFQKESVHTVHTL